MALRDGDDMELMGDRPLTDPARDRLERGPIVDLLVQMLRQSPSNGYTVAVVGPWGDGKSTILNFVAQRVDARGDAQIVVFQPWWFSTGEELVVRFFGELAAQLNLHGGRSGALAATRLMTFAKALAPAHFLGFAAPARLAQSAARGLARLLNEGRLSIAEERERLSVEMRKLARPVVIVIDEIDRLSAPEIVEVMRLIRAVGDLPNIRYLLAFEPRAVRRALGDGDEAVGAVAMEKIVQTVIDVPPVRPDLLSTELTAALNKAIEPLSDAGFSSQRWTELQVAGVHQLFTNMRDVNRLASGLPKTLAAIGEEVEASDVIALEILRLAEPASYSALVSRGDLLTGDRRHRWWLSDERTAEADAEILRPIVERATSPEVVRDVVQYLFPAAAQHFGGTKHGPSFQATWRRGGLVAHQVHLQTYLNRGVALGTPRRRDIEAAISSVREPARLRDLLRQPESRLMPLLSRLEDFAEAGIDLPDPAGTIAVFLARRWDAPRERTEPFAIDLAVAIDRVVLRLLRPLGPDAVAHVFDDLSFPDLSARAELIRYIAGDSPLTTPEHAALVEAALVADVLTAEGAVLAREPDMMHLIWRCREHDETALRRSLRRWVGDDAFLARWLAGSRRSRIGFGDDSLDWASVTNDVPADVLHPRIAAIAVRRGELSADEQAVLDEALSLVDAAQAEPEGSDAAS